MFSVVPMLMLAVSAPPAGTGPTAVHAGLVKPEVAATRVAACGFKSVRPRFDDTLQEDVVEVLDAAPVSEDQLRCAALASLDFSYYVTFPAPVSAAYEALYRRMSDERDKADARAWLEQRGLLSRLPTYDPERSNEAAFAHALEALCGPKAVGTLQPMHGGATFKEGALPSLRKSGFFRGKLNDETFRCLINAATAADYPLVFIGNGAYQERP